MWGLFFWVRGLKGVQKLFSGFTRVCMHRVMSRSPRDGKDFARAFFRGFLWGVQALPGFFF